MLVAGNSRRRKYCSRRRGKYRKGRELNPVVPCDVVLVPVRGGSSQGTDKSEKNDRALGRSDTSFEK